MTLKADRSDMTLCRRRSYSGHPIPAFPVQASECWGRNRAELVQSPDLLALPRFARISLDNLGPDWWHIAGDMSRIRTFLAWLQCCPETRIALVAHWGFIHNLMRLVNCGTHLQLRNCCYIETVWNPSAPAMAAVQVPPLRPNLVVCRGRGYSPGSDGAFCVGVWLCQFMYPKCPNHCIRAPVLTPPSPSSTVCVRQFFYPYEP